MFSRRSGSFSVILCLVSILVFHPHHAADAFAVSRPSPTRSVSTQLFISRAPSRNDKSKRQERFGHLVRSEVAQLLHHGTIKSDDYLEGDLRRRISVVNADLSPDLRQARISISVRGDAVVDQRRAYSWLVRNTKPIRHGLAQKLKHLKVCPNLTFVQVDVAAAVDVMYLIDKVSEGYKRENVDPLDGYELDDDDEDWEDDDNDFFDKDD